MITDPAEIAELRRSTEDLIAEEGMPIALIRAGEEWTRTAAGGIRKNATNPATDTQDPVRRYFGDSAADPKQVESAQGEQLVLDRVLIGTFDDDIREGDEFMVSNRKFLVGEVHPDHIFETKAWCVERA